MTSSSRSIRLAATLALSALVAVACGDAGDPRVAPSPAETAATGQQLAVAPASYDLAVGDDQRFIAGVLTPQRALVAFGEVTMRFGFLGEDQTATEAELSQEATATFLPVPGLAPDGEADAPTVLTDTTGAGVYETSIDLDQAGFWGVQVEATLADGSTRTGTATFRVAESHQVPTVGDDAPRSDNLTLDDEGDVPAAAIDSRAQGGGDIPDPDLHDATIAETIEQGRPALVLFSTPVYCVSRFCGPITSSIADLADEYGDAVEVIHVEVWADFEAQELNPAASEWIFDEQAGGNEPWTFLVDADGTIAARWDNVADLAEIETMLEELASA